MPVYEFRCKNEDCELGAGQIPIQAHRALGDTDPPSCPSCDTTTSRKFTTFTARNSMPDHFNTATGQYVRNERDLKDQFKRLSDETSARTNLDHSFVPHDPREMKDQLGVTDEGLEATYRHHRDHGDPAIARRMKREKVWVD